MLSPFTLQWRSFCREVASRETLRDLPITFIGAGAEMN